MSLAGCPALAGEIQLYGRTDEILRGGLVDPVALSDVDGTPHLLVLGIPSRVDDQ